MSQLFHRSFRGVFTAEKGVVMNYVELFHRSFRGVFTAKKSLITDILELFHRSFRGVFTAWTSMELPNRNAVPPLISRGFHSGASAAPVHGHGCSTAHFEGFSQQLFKKIIFSLRCSTAHFEGFSQRYKGEKNGPVAVPPLISRGFHSGKSTLA